MKEPTPYERAIARLDATVELEAYRATILYGWPESDEFYAWVATCELSQLIAWAKLVECQALTPSSQGHFLDAPGWAAHEEERCERLRRGNRRRPRL